MYISSLLKSFKPLKYFFSLAGTGNQIKGSLTYQCSRQWGD